MKPGELVRLKSGGPSMTIAKVVEGRARCIWFDGGTLCKSILPIAALVTTEQVEGPEPKIFDPASVTIPPVRGDGDMGGILAHSMETQKKAALQRLDEVKPLLRDD
jgi:uncharacterized protein YodC (DUF2158 family)